MRKSTQGNIQKNITISPELYAMICAQAKSLGLDFQEYVRFYLAVLAKKGHPFLDLMEKLDPGFTDTLAIMSNKEIQAVFEEDEEHIVKKKLKSFEKSLIEEA